MSPPDLRDLNRDQRAVAMVEFTIVLVPLLAIFLCFIELTRLSIASLMVQRAAGIAVRACAVVKDQPLHCDSNHGMDGQNTGAQNATILRAAREAIRPLSDTTLVIESAPCETNIKGSTPIGNVPSDWRTTGTDRVDVAGRFHCYVPLARDILCGVDFRQPNARPFRMIHASAKHAHQGASFDCMYAGDPEFDHPLWPEPL